MVNQTERSGRYCELTYSLDLYEELRELQTEQPFLLQSGNNEI